MPQNNRTPSKVLEKIKDIGDLPVMTATIRQITHLEKQETSSAADLAQVILKDLALTTRVLKLANSVYYNWSQKEITTVSRAVVVLGFETVINLSVGVSVLDYFYRSPRSKHLRAHLFVTMFAAIFSRILAERLGFKNFEEVFILTLLNNVGLLMTAYGLPEEFEQIRQMVITGEKGKNTAAKEILGTTFSDLNIELTRFWGFPPTLISELELVNLGSPGIIVTKDDILRSIVACATELFYSLHAREAFWVPRDTKQVMKRYFPALEIPEDQGKALIRRAIHEGKEFLDVLQMEFSPKEFNTLAEEFVAEFPVSEEKAIETPGTLPWWKMSQQQRAQFMKNTMADIDNSIQENVSPNDVLMIAMEGILKGVGFDRVILFLVDRKQKKLRAKAGIGDPLPDDIASLTVDIHDNANDHFNISVREIRPFLVPSVKRPPDRALVNWDLFNQLKGTSFCLLPFSFMRKTIGLFYADRVRSNKPVSDSEFKSLLQFKALIEAAFQLRAKGK